MWAALKLFVSNNVAKVLEILAVVLSAFGVVAAIYRAGGKAAENKQLELELQNTEEANAVRNKNRANLRPGDAAEQLREKW